MPTQSRISIRKCSIAKSGPIVASFSGRGQVTGYWVGRVSTIVNSVYI